MARTYVYLDHAAATPLDPRVLQAMQPFFSDDFYNPSATYEPARKVAARIRDARAMIAHWLGARPSEIIFTSGGTEANNLAIYGVMAAYPGAKIIVSAIEHEAVLRPAARYDNRQAKVTAEGILDLENLRSCIDDNTVMVSIMYANNEIGTIQPVREVSALVAAIRKERRAKGIALPLYLHTDACQAANLLDLHVARLGADLMTLNGGKAYGPKQSGVLYVKAGVQLQPLVLGGGQESGLRSGTENVAACVGLATAIDRAQQIRHLEVERLHALQHLFIKLLSERMPDIRINGSLKKRLPSNVHITIPGHDNERLLIELENRGILASAGSACSASNEEPSHVLRALGLTDEEARSSLRFRMGRQTTEAEITQTADVLVAITA